MKIIEGWGTGLPRLFRQCRERGLPEPKFEEFGDGIKVTIYRRSDSEWVVLISDYTKWRQKYFDNSGTEDFQAAAIAYAKNNPS